MDEFQIYGKAVIGYEVVDNVTVKVEDGLIAGVSHNLWPGVKTFRLRAGEILFPAATDLHVHLRDWKEKGKETIITGTRAAVKGGVTTVVEMPNTKPPINTEETLNRRLKKLSLESLVDFGVYFGVPENLEELRKVKGKVVGVKVYPSDILRLHEIFAYAKKLRMRVVVHPEIIGGDEASTVSWVTRIKPRGVRLRLAHVSRDDSMWILEKVKRRGSGITVEATPHHALLSKDFFQTYYLNQIGYVRPTIGERNDAEAVFRGIVNGVVDFVASDHAPHRLSEKGPGRAPGYPGLETMVPLMVTQWVRGRLPLRRLVEVLMENPAKYLNIRKGKIKVGYYADLMVLNVKRQFRIDPNNFESKAKYSPFIGWKVVGAPVYVFRRGEVLLDDGEIFPKSAGKNVLTLHKIF